MSQFRMGCLYRYVRTPDSSIAFIDGLPNFHHVVAMKGRPSLQLERGISTPQETRAVDGPRIAVVLLSSNENKRGSIENPWHDTITPDEGSASYFGDNKTPGEDPGTARGNRALLRQFELHTAATREMRKRAAPILIFRSGRKGFKEFAGLGVITGARRVTQFSEKNGGFFTNYLFDLAILALTDEDESVPMMWISDRRNEALDADAANAMAPKSWLDWVKYGSAVIEKVRRRVARYHIIPRREQMSPPNSGNRKILESIYQYYDNRKHRFEALASLACESMVKETGSSYHRGWLTRGTGDGGLDFVGRIDIGKGFSLTKLVLLGQAKCERIDQATGGVHIARTVARLRRGWVGAYVTTSFFSEPVQREVHEDQYPVMLLNGASLAEHTRKLQVSSGFTDIGDFLSHVDSSYEDQVSSRRPEEVLWD